jgi:hypothetical protein
MCKAPMIVGPVRDHPPTPSPDPSFFVPSPDPSGPPPQESRGSRDRRSLAIPKLAMPTYRAYR